MSGMQRQAFEHGPFDESESPVVLPHGTMVGLSLKFDQAPTSVTVTVDSEKDGSFGNSVSLVGSGDYRYPDEAGTNTLFHAAFVKIEWAGATLQKVFQKG